MAAVHGIKSCKNGPVALGNVHINHQNVQKMSFKASWSIIVGTRWAAMGISITANLLGMSLSQSLDLNPAEHLWDVVQHEIHSIKVHEISAGTAWCNYVKIVRYHKGMFPTSYGMHGKKY